MRNWTDRKHEQARHANEVLADDPMLGIMFPGLITAFTQALDEIERLRAEAEAPSPDPGVEFAEWVMEFVPSDRQDEAWREFTRSKVRICLGDHKTEGQLREELHETESQLREATARMRSTLDRVIRTDAGA